MRYRVLWVLLLVTLLPAWAVEYGLNTAIAMTVRVTAVKVGPGEVVRLSVSASDSDVEMGANQRILRLVDDPVTISWEATGGSFQKVSTGSNPVELNWQAPLQPGFYVIYLTADDSGKYADDPPVRHLVEMSVTRAGETPAPQVRVSVNPSFLRLDRGRTSTISAQLLGNTGIRGKTVRFFATRGRLSAATAVTDAAGVATVRLTASRDDVGTAVVAAFYGNTTSTATLIISEHGQAPPYPDPPYPPYPPGPNPSDFGVGVEPAAIPADGQSTALVTVRLTDLRGYGIRNQIVTFRVTMGGIAPQRTITDYYGYARARVYAPTTPGAGTIIAESGGKRGYAIITFTDPRPQQPVAGMPRLFLTVDPTQQPADGVSTVRVEALLLDQDGRAMPDTTVTFTSSLGALRDTRVQTDAGGKATTTLTAPDRPGLATITAASQINFLGLPTGGPGLDLRLWSGQHTTFVAERWMVRTIQVENGARSGLSRQLLICDDTAKVTKEVPLGQYGILIQDQYGSARGYGIDEAGKVTLILLKSDGTVLRTGTLTLPAGTHLVDAQYAEPQGNLLIASAKPDGTAPEMQLLSPALTPLRVWREGLEAMPVAAVSGDGYLVIALSGGTTRLYAPDGQLISEVRRHDGLPTTAVVTAPAGAWYAVATGPESQNETKPKLHIFSRQGTELLTFDLEVLRLMPVNTTALFAATADRSVYLSIPDRRALWTLIGGYERALATGDLLVIAGLRDPKDAAILLPKLLVLRQKDGGALATQDLNPVEAIHAVLPPDEQGMIGVVTMPYSFRFPLPK